MEHALKRFFIHIIICNAAEQDAHAFRNPKCHRAAATKRRRVCVRRALAFLPLEYGAGGFGGHAFAFS